MLLLTGSLAFAMGYPQDMFAEHVVAKPSAKASANLTNNKKPLTVNSFRKTKTRQSCLALPADIRPAVSHLNWYGAYEAGLGSSAVLGMTIRMVEKQVKINGVKPDIRFSALPLGRLIEYLKEGLQTFLRI
jgi:hypothetical protein